MARYRGRNVFYSAWRLKNRDALIAAGKPERLVDDDTAFWFVVPEGEG
jgi:hypothetical protein